MLNQIEQSWSETQNINQRNDLPQSALIIALNNWRHQVGKFDDESIEYVLPESLMIFLDSQKQQIRHNQDLLNLCFDNMEYVPFFIKIYQAELTEIILNNQTENIDTLK